ncbi:MAG TPA: flagellar hook capping FlgD N-terminal domain-containing protein [Candidatus Binataceae bacterium]|nr:flagellar hook capping FlgD N-terminal domain-containing protein [Candidatus Binataceae bacterium]
MSTTTAATAPAAPAPASNPATPTTPTSLLTSTSFLQILVAEFQNQDPTTPTDPTQFATQLVQFANLGQLQNIDSAVTQPPATGLMQAASAYIGREVLAPGNQLGLLNGKATSISFTPSVTDSYTAQVFNAAGAQVDTVALGTQTAGTLDTFTWSPPSGNPDGAYSVNIVNSAGAPSSGLIEQGVVQSVSLTSTGVALDLGNLVIPQNQVGSVGVQPSGN